MKRNYSELIASKQKRQLTAKGCKFLNNCIEIAVKQHGLTRYHKEMKPLKEKLTTVLNFLIVDEEKTLNEIKEIIKNRNILIKN